MKKWCIVYVVGNTYKNKYIFAETPEKAIKKARIKNIIDVEEVPCDCEVIQCCIY